MSASGCAHSKVLTSAMCTQGLHGWISLILTAAGWQDGWKHIVSLVRMKFTMKSFKGQQQREFHLKAQRQPAHLAEEQWDKLRTKSSAYQAGGHCLAFQMASKGSLECDLLLYSEVAVRGVIIPCFSSKAAWPSKHVWKPSLWFCCQQSIQQIPWTLSSIYKPLALHPQPLDLWLLPCSLAFTSSDPARLHSARQTSLFLLLLW